MNRSRCTCETHGECYPCRYQRETSPYMRDVFCHWCWADITYRVQYTLGDWTDRHKVCGVNCPARPKKEEPMASRKDYEELAEVLRSQQKYINKAAYRSLVSRIGEMYAKDNPNFKVLTWRKACGLYDL